jgi:hypothetical protein
MVYRVQNNGKTDGLAFVSKTLAGVGRLKKVCKHAFRLVGAIQGISSSNMLRGQGADFVKVVGPFLRDRRSRSCDLAFLFRGRQLARHIIGQKNEALTLNHLSFHQSVRSAIHASQQLSSPIGFLFLKFPPPPCAGVLVHTGTYWYILVNLNLPSTPTFFRSTLGQHVF